MLVAVIGGNLQGVEATYLAKKAGWDVTVFDKRPDAAATGLCDSFVKLNICDANLSHRIFKGFDLIIPAIENDNALSRLCEITENTEIPLVFDPVAYAITSSKLKSDSFFEQYGIPAPQPWPDCDFPVVAKPSVGSGSDGVRFINNARELQKAFPDADAMRGWVLQEVLKGDSYSIEVVGFPGNYKALQVTDLGMDAVFDCKRVTAPTILSALQIRQFKRTAIEIANRINLHGIMDVEVIPDGDELKVLEIDARLPSQTPTAVFWSTGMNIIRMLGNLYVKGPESVYADQRFRRGVIFEHISVKSGILSVEGEHIMSGSGPLKIEKDFFGADEAITNYDGRCHEWVATLIITDTDLESAKMKREKVMADIMKHFDIVKYEDLEPAAYKGLM
ncbi:MAG: 3-methylornithine--L-lysine ligase PylC [Desulfobacterales bacterium]|nr:3-methylornithine--L-lysine ligase PylC [Desulfobacterales bacterium]